MKLTYLYHSGFLLECEKCYVVFDYFLDGYDLSSSFYDKGGLARAIGPLGSDQLVEQDDIEKFESLEISAPNTSNPGTLGSLIVNLDKPCYVLASHFHKDHFLPFIFKILDYAKARRAQESTYPEVKLILSSDILKYRRKVCAPYVNELTFLAKGESYQDDLIKINAYGSTDVGGSFAVHVPEHNFSLFHAGDFNYWHWQEESTPQEITQAHDFFLKELAFIERHESYFDVVLFPVDPRMQKNIAAGAQEFFEKINYQLLVPMHVIEKPQEVLSELKSNELFSSCPISYDQEGKERIYNLSLSKSASKEQLQVWLPHNSGDCALINFGA